MEGPRFTRITQTLSTRPSQLADTLLKIAEPFDVSNLYILPNMPDHITRRPTSRKICSLEVFLCVVTHVLGRYNDRVPWTDNAYLRAERIGIAQAEFLIL
jgi:hypothetical protein